MDRLYYRSNGLAGLDHFLLSFGGMGNFNDVYLCPENGTKKQELERIVESHPWSYWIKLSHCAEIVSTHSAKVGAPLRR